MHAVAKVEPGLTFAMSRCDSHCDSLQQLATGVSPVAKLVAAIFHSINRALGPRKVTLDKRGVPREILICSSVVLKLVFFLSVL